MRNYQINFFLPEFYPEKLNNNSNNRMKKKNFENYSVKKALKINQKRTYNVTPKIISSKKKIFYFHIRDAHAPNKNNNDQFC